MLIHQEFARFRDMRPKNVDTNLYSYHLKLLIKQGLVAKTPEGYTLTIEGMKYVDRLNANTTKLVPQPKIITMLVIQNGYGGVLMKKKSKQPFIDRWSVPLGKVHNDDQSIQHAAERELQEKVGDYMIALNHVGDAYIRVANKDDIQISTLAHVFYGTGDDSMAADGAEWIDPHDIEKIETAPGMKQIIARTFFNDPFFFEQFEETW